MKKVLKFFSVTLLAVFVFSFFGVSHIFADDSVGVACDICGSPDSPNNHNSCGVGLDCIEKQCQDPSKITYCSFSSNKIITDLIDKVSSWMLVIALVLVPLMILLGAFYMLTAAGDPSRSAKGRTIIIWASIALAIFLFAKALVSILRYFVF
ncbi:MAG: pilin [bacterium]|nr:pilin [bacterium]